MTISRVELQGQVTRAQDFTNIKQNEDHKGMIDQSNFQSQTQQKVEHRMHQVNKSDQAENRQKKGKRDLCRRWRTEPEASSCGG